MDFEIFLENSMKLVSFFFFFFFFLELGELTEWFSYIMQVRNFHTGINAEFTCDTEV